MTEYGRIHTDGSRSGGQPLLLPCPFCGAQPHHGLSKVMHDGLHGDPYQRFLVWCPKDHAKVDKVNREQAFAAWNTRQPTQSNVVAAAAPADRIGGGGGLPCGVVGVATQSDALLEGDAQTILYLLGVRHGREDERAKIAAETRQSTQSDALREALEDLLHAVCGENGFVQAVRWDSGRIYPHPALDLAEAKARAALEQGK